MYQVERIKGGYSIKGDGVDIIAEGYDFEGYRPNVKLTGKGARKIGKDAVIAEVKEFLKAEYQNKVKELEAQAEAWRASNPQIKENALYNVTLNYKDNYNTYGRDFDKTSNELMIGSIVKEFHMHNIINAEEIDIQDTDIYGLGRLIGSGQGWVDGIRADKRIFAFMNGISVTGKALKEFINQGERLHTIHKRNEGLQAFNEQAKKFAFGQIQSLSGGIGEERQLSDIDMYERFLLEVARAKGE